MLTYQTSCNNSCCPNIKCYLCHVCSVTWTVLFLSSEYYTDTALAYRRGYTENFKIFRTFPLKYH